MEVKEFEEGFSFSFPKALFISCSARSAVRECHNYCIATYFGPSSLAVYSGGGKVICERPHQVLTMMMMMMIMPFMMSRCVYFVGLT